MRTICASWDILRTLYPKVRVSLHAGELAPGLVPPEGLCCHIRLAVEQAKADRIGHGVDVMYENRPYELMKDMAAKRVMVEINLTSNDVILGIKGKHHPFSLYRKFGVPVALSTDDEGISRIDLTHEYVRAVETYDLSYADLKHLVRNSLEYSFLPGASLWASPTMPAWRAPARATPAPRSRRQPARPSSREARRRRSNGSLRSGFGSSKPDSSLDGLAALDRSFAPPVHDRHAKNGGSIGELP